MSQQQCLGNTVIVIAALMLLTIVSAWNKRRQIKDVLELFAAWCILISCIVGFWVMVTIGVKSLLNK